MLSAQNLLDACATAVLAVTPDDGLIVAANQACEELLGYATHNLIGRPITDIEVGLQDLFFWEEIREGGCSNTSNVEGEYRHENGHFLQVRKSVRCIEDQGQLLCVISVHDISRAKQMEMESALAASLLAATLESTADGILVTDLDGNIRNFNHQVPQIWQWSAEQTVSGDDLFLHIESQLLDPAQFRAWLDELYSDPYLASQHSCALRDGRFFDLSSRPQRLGDTPVGRLFGMHDISAIKHHENELRIARDGAQAASKAKSDFLSHMSHELRTPLNAILGFAQIISADQDYNQRELGSYISKAGRHLLDLINEVLDLASIEAGKLALRDEAVDLALIIQDCLELTQNLATEKNVTLLQTQMPTARFMVQGDARRIKQILLNFVSNAIKYNRPQGTVEMTVTHSTKHTWRLMVSDTGRGISVEDQAKLFQPFSRVGNNNDSIEGTGIGLAFTQRLAELMKGQVGFTSTVNVGSRFWIDLPCAKGLTQAIKSTTTCASGQRNILYIEDDLLSQKLLQAIFKQQRPNYNVLLAGTGKDGLNLAQHQHPDLIVLDQHLPDASGFAILEQLRSNDQTRSIPVIALSGDALEDDIQKALHMGFDAYITKPLEVKTALPLIDKILGNTIEGYQLKNNKNKSL
ncbi:MULTISPECIES: PAS domain-containing hybrid sensor histidine kinase/response regulator [Deefgea]|uniref:histidine kinase n=1 Tax=Deefgea chitinilytica TaxID=570276 RepID=A0ABS2CA31_9NEIS|nr:MULTISPECIES: PAS domain-containing hybrid sensor histidine kinase/response regulator [Deefgea]MBM5570912.1 response regulator [Deefgea chitinilytica]MBM9888141.1 response regulator [Deefgea sp. CFH1-16]